MISKLLLLISLIALANTQSYEVTFVTLYEQSYGSYSTASASPVTGNVSAYSTMYFAVDATNYLYSASSSALVVSLQSLQSGGSITWYLNYGEPSSYSSTSASYTCTYSYGNCTGDSYYYSASSMGVCNPDHGIWYIAVTNNGYTATSFSLSVQIMSSSTWTTYGGNSYQSCNLWSTSYDEPSEPDEDSDDDVAVILISVFVPLGAGCLSAVLIALCVHYRRKRTCTTHKPIVAQPILTPSQHYYHPSMHQPLLHQQPQLIYQPGGQVLAVSQPPPAYQSINKTEKTSNV